MGDRYAHFGSAWRRGLGAVAAPSPSSLLGVVSYHDAIVDREHLKPFLCYPPTATRNQGIQAFIDWAGSHQQDHKFMDDPPVVGAVRGLAAKWPCK